MKIIKVFAVLFLFTGSLDYLDLQAQCGTCPISSNPQNNTKECVRCKDNSGDACIMDSGPVKCCENCGGGGVN